MEAKKWVSALLVVEPEDFLVSSLGTLHAIPFRNQYDTSITFSHDRLNSRIAFGRHLEK